MMFDDEEYTYKEGVIEGPKRKRKGRHGPKRRVSARTKAYTKRKAQRHPTRTIKVDIDITPEQSIRGSFEEGTERYVDSEIIYFFMYDAPSQRLAVQLNANGKWKWYTYLGVSIREAYAFEHAPSKGRHFNKYIKKHDFLPGKHI